MVYLMRYGLTPTCQGLQDLLTSGLKRAGGRSLP